MRTRNGNIINLYYIVAVHHRDSAGFIDKAAYRLRIVFYRVLEHFYRDTLARRYVICLENDRHAADSDGFYYFISAVKNLTYVFIVCVCFHF